MLFAVPKEGLTIRDPRTRTIVPAEGVPVPEHDPYWEALAKFGDVELVDREPGPEPDHETLQLAASQRPAAPTEAEHEQ